MHRDLEMLYVQRYWALMDARSVHWVLDRNPTPEDRVVVRGYLQLCEDEIDLRRLGRVTDNTRGFWDESMLSQLHDPPYLAALNESGHTE